MTTTRPVPTVLNEIRMYVAYPALGRLARADVPPWVPVGEQVQERLRTMPPCALYEQCRDTAAECYLLPDGASGHWLDLCRMHNHRLVVEACIAAPDTITLLEPVLFALAAPEPDPDAVLDPPLQPADLPPMAKGVTGDG